MEATKMSPETHIAFGPPYAVLNLSKLGLRYFRIGLTVSDASRDRLVKSFVNHPNVGWIFSAEGWFTLAIGIWARDNAEINDVSAAIRATLEPDDKVVFQSELTSLYGFGNRAAGKDAYPMPIIDSVYQHTELSPLELDYIKLVTMNSSLPKDELAQILNISTEEVDLLTKKLTDAGVLVGYQERIDYGGFYYKVFVDTSSRRKIDALETLTDTLWHDPRCIYFERANSVYDLEFEIILESKDAIHAYLRDFSEYQMAILTQNLYTNLYPLSKIASFKDIQTSLESASGGVLDLGNSKLWYLNYDSAEGYLSIYENREYFEAMEKSELDLFDDVIAQVREYGEAMYSVIDIGSGDGMKSRVFIEKLGEKSVKAFYPVDVQPIELAAALKSHVSGAYAKHPTLLDFENLSARFPLTLGPDEKQIYLFLGGTYGNYPSSVINKYLSAVLSPSSQLIITMPIRTNKSDEEIIGQYSGLSMGAVAFGPLAQVGFDRQDFERNPQVPTLHMHVSIENSILRTYFVLKNNVTVSGRTYSKGTVFKMTSSWKPTLDEVRAALEQDFIIEKTFSNDAMSMSLVRAK